MGAALVEASRPPASPHPHRGPRASPSTGEPGPVPAASDWPRQGGYFRAKTQSGHSPEPQLFINSGETPWTTPRKDSRQPQVKVPLHPRPPATTETAERLQASRRLTPESAAGTFPRPAQPPAQSGADRASPLQNVGRQGLSADVRHRVLLDPQVVLPQALGRCRGGPLTAVAAHLVERNADVHEGPETRPLCFS